MTHVEGATGGLWLSARKETQAPLPLRRVAVHIAYADTATAPTHWEVTGLTCAQQGAHPQPAALGGFGSEEAPTNVSRCHWIREVAYKGGRDDALELELSASGLAEVQLHAESVSVSGCMHFAIVVIRFVWIISQRSFFTGCPLQSSGHAWGLRLGHWRGGWSTAHRSC